MCPLCALPKINSPNTVAQLPGDNTYIAPYDILPTKTSRFLYYFIRISCIDNTNVKKVQPKPLFT